MSHHSFICNNSINPFTLQVVLCRLFRTRVREQLLFNSLHSAWSLCWGAGVLTWEWLSRNDISISWYFYAFLEFSFQDFPVHQCHCFGRFSGYTCNEFGCPVNRLVSTYSSFTWPFVILCPFVVPNTDRCHFVPFNPDSFLGALEICRFSHFWHIVVKFNAFKWRWLKWVKWVKCLGFFAWMPVQGCVLGGSFDAYECVHGAFASSFQERQKMFKYHPWFQVHRHRKPIHGWNSYILNFLNMSYMIVCPNMCIRFWVNFCKRPGGAFATRVFVNARMGSQLGTSAFHEGSMHKLLDLT